MVKHTPGPWMWIDSYDYHKDRHDWESENFKEGRVELHAPDGSNVLSAWGDYAADLGLMVTPGNMRLIAAAPDLLEACKMVVNQCDHAPPVQLIQMLAKACDVCRIAIAKAEGKDNG